MKWKEEIGEFLKDKLRLELNDRRQKSGPISNGIDFLGYIVRPDYFLVRRRVINRLKARLMQYQKRLKKDKDNYRVLIYDPPVLEKVMNSWASYMAHLDMASTYRLRKKLLRRFAWLGELFQMDGVKLKRIHEAPVTLRTLKGQYRFFLGRYQGSILFFQVGRFYELYDRQAEIAIKVLGLKGMRKTRVFRARCGFPVNQKRKYLGGLLSLGFAIHIVNEGKVWLTSVKKRRVVESWTPMFVTTVEIGSSTNYELRQASEVE